MNTVEIKTVFETIEGAISNLLGREVSAQRVNGNHRVRFIYGNKKYVLTNKISGVHKPLNNFWLFPELAEQLSSRGKNFNDSVKIVSVSGSQIQIESSEGLSIYMVYEIKD